MIELYSPKNETELALIKSILESEGIDYYVRNDHFGSMKVGPRIELFNAKTFLVSKNDDARARELISDFLITTAEQTEKDRPGYSLFDKVRMIFEVMLFHWIMPGKRRRRKKAQ
jgi:hypothetical protein